MSRINCSIELCILCNIVRMSHEIKGQNNTSYVMHDVNAPFTQFSDVGRPIMIIMASFCFGIEIQQHTIHEK